MVNEEYNEDETKGVNCMKKQTYKIYENLFFLGIFDCKQKTSSKREDVFTQVAGLHTDS